ncbi:Thiamine biosynthesis lipoprotein ApbE precursor [Anaerohalosphaera lusitana]|uniref:FAD:protein FMN transferase n=1 Tax=Anaerohalosphaera lusitana TaxID=1936003 RepID=A0A1U9NNF8_9BACT|nr:FAD:protein FMN transferase [Anaerohalosphaera lusitana]AQT69268.1 Thiamine biosynthesis lipoprotein ApbE precursor [Anaerohalosphaera lusitana]
MSKDKQEVNAFSFPGSDIANLQRFRKEAMATIFHVFIVHEDREYAGQAAWEAFDVLDDLEQHFSRFIANSDISQINRLGEGESVVVSLPTFECLQQAKDMYERTFGAFDVTVGTLYKAWLREDKSIKMPGREELEFAREHTGADKIKLNEESFTVTLEEAPLSVDLGGIGKGFAIDRMMEVLREWEVESAMISGGGSTVLASGAPAGLDGWPIKVRSPLERSHTLTKLDLCGQAFSGSGIIKSQHIIDPRKGMPVSSVLSAWASAENGAFADALSTAATVMSRDEMRKYCEKHRGAMLMTAVKNIDKPGDVEMFKAGCWPEK